MAWLSFVFVNQPRCLDTDTDFPGVQTDIFTLQACLVRYRTRTGFVPSQAQGLDALVNKPSGDPALRTWTQLAAASSLLDPWGHPYQYRNPSKRDAGIFDIYSMGPDGLDGTADDIYAY